MQADLKAKKLYSGKRRAAFIKRQSIIERFLPDALAWCRKSGISYREYAIHNTQDCLNGITQTLFEKSRISHVKTAKNLAYAFGCQNRIENLELKAKTSDKKMRSVTPRELTPVKKAQFDRIVSLARAIFDEAVKRGDNWAIGKLA